MVNHSDENNEFKRLRKLGMKFDDGGEYLDQPDSGSVIGGGKRGEQEYGIGDGDELEGAAVEDLETLSVDFPENGEDADGADSAAGSRSLGVPGRDMSPVSEWSESHARMEEDLEEPEDMPERAPRQPAPVKGRATKSRTGTAKGAARARK